ncbi:uncharacterized protein [Prorops nasuta]|uniref:uncharacterized protein n=1 Tax=Prorops nasuta TaxID=863751 RepID=UPI0034CE5034
MQKIEEDSNLLNKILFSVESTFVLVPSPNKQNTRLWSQSNPYEYTESHTQYQQKVNVWLGILCENIIGPIFINGNLNSEKYLTMLKEEVDPRVLSITENSNVVFQQDGAPAHTARVVVQYLHAKYPGRWIGKNGPVEWPPRSPDLAALNFGIWGILKNEIYNALEIESLEDLKNKIIAGCERITLQQLQHVLQCFVKRLEYCSAVAGGIFEPYL